MCLDGFFPHDGLGFATEIFSSFTELLPVMTFCISVIASSFGISKFFVVGPLRLISQNTPLSGMISFTFLALLFLNLGFIFRIYAIEHSLFSEYITSSGTFSYEKWGTTIKKIDPVLSYQYRLIFYLIPILPSLVINILCLHKTLTLKSLLKFFVNFPQYLVTSCFLPFIFRGIVHLDEDQRTCQFKIKVHKMATILNSIYIMFAPQVLLVISDICRGVIDWEFTSSSNKYWDLLNGQLETNSGVTKNRFGNISFSIVVCVSSFVVLTLLFWRDGSLFLQQSDALGSKYLGEEHWEFRWVRNEYSKEDSTNCIRVINKSFQS